MVYYPDMRLISPEISQAILNIVYPIYCQGCDIKLSFDNRTYLCRRCTESIGYIAAPICFRCGLQLTGDVDQNALCASCAGNHYHFKRAYQCCKYDGLIRELIHKFKYNRKLFLKKILTEIMYDFTKDYICDSIDMIVPVPMQRSQVTKRGFNQSLILSEGLASALKIDHPKDILIKTRSTKQQVGLEKRERLNNIKGAFSISNGNILDGKNILLVDDVFTTGATVNECAKTLASGGAASVSVLTLARGV
ncbi:ComF family protein [Candidatus Omnitrophota bacterium]